MRLARDRIDEGEILTRTEVISVHKGCVTERKEKAQHYNKQPHGNVASHIA